MDFEGFNDKAHFLAYRKEKLEQMIEFFKQSGWVLKDCFLTLGEYYFEKDGIEIEIKLKYYPNGLH